MFGPPEICIGWKGPALALAAALWAAACGGMGRRPALADHALASPVLLVENGHWQEIRVYLFRGPTSRRLLGSVRAGESAAFGMRTTHVGEAVRLQLQPVGLRSESFLVPYAVATGQLVSLRIANILARSVVWVPDDE